MQSRESKPERQEPCFVASSRSADVVVVRMRPVQGGDSHEVRAPSEPKYQTDGAAGADLCACIDEPISIDPGCRALVPTGLSLSIPSGFEGQIRPRSGLALRHGVTVLNAPGTVDSDYRGELKVLLINLGSSPFVVHSGDRIAQLVLASVVRAEFVETLELDDTARGDGGYGSTGV